MRTIIECIKCKKRYSYQWFSKDGEDICEYCEPKEDI